MIRDMLSDALGRFVLCIFVLCIAVIVWILIYSAQHPCQGTEKLIGYTTIMVKSGDTYVPVLIPIYDCESK